MKNSAIPNLFHFATSELSQDATFCWLLSHVSLEHQFHKPAMHRISQLFLRALIEATKLALPDMIQDLRIERQYKNIDILCEIDRQFILVIEDKTNTQQSKHQLAKYREIAQADFSDHKHGFVYLKTGDQSDFSAVIDEGYTVFGRHQLLKVFETPDGDLAAQESDTFAFFRAYLREIENRVQSFKLDPGGQWSSDAWVGFFLELQVRLGQGHWGYVANPTGGFMGFWCGSQAALGCDVYLQIEAKPKVSIKLCFKIGDVENVSLRDVWHLNIMRSAREHSLQVKKPLRFGAGQYMTVAQYDQNFPVCNSEGRLDLDGSLKVIDQALKTITRAVLNEQKLV
jgi:hypothetical protein